VKSFFSRNSIGSYTGERYSPSSLDFVTVLLPLITDDGQDVEKITYIYMTAAD